MDLLVLRVCLRLLYKLYREATSQKTEVSGALTTLFFLGAESSWSYTCLDEKHGEELKKMDQSSPKTCY
jgi:hypothetical protein